MERVHLLGKENCPLTSQLLRFWKKKYSAAAHTTAVATMQKSGMGRTFSELRSCGWEAEASCTTCTTWPAEGEALRLPGPCLPSWWCRRLGRAAGYRWRCPACRKQSPWVGRWVQRGRWAHGEELFCSHEQGFVTFVAFSLSYSHLGKEGNFFKKHFTIL